MTLICPDKIHLVKSLSSIDKINLIKHVSVHTEVSGNLLDFIFLTNFQLTTRIDIVHILKTDYFCLKFELPFEGCQASEDASNLSRSAFKWQSIIEMFLDDVASIFATSINSYVEGTRNCPHMILSIFRIRF